MAYFNPSSEIKFTDKRTVWGKLRLPKYQHDFRNFLQQNVNEAYVRRSYASRVRMKTVVKGSEGITLIHHALDLIESHPIVPSVVEAVDDAAPEPQSSRPTKSLAFKWSTCLGLPSSVRLTITIWRPASMLTRKPRFRRLCRRLCWLTGRRSAPARRLGHQIAGRGLQE